MEDRALVERINALSAEEEQLWSRAASEGGFDGTETARLEQIRLELEQAYDLLNQRRARRAAGLDPDDATVRPIETVDRYQQ